MYACVLDSSSYINTFKPYIYIYFRPARCIELVFGFAHLRTTAARVWHAVSKGNDAVEKAVHVATGQGEQCTF
jgi:hypothetical protein